MHLDRVAVENGQILRRDNILVQDNIYLLAIYPLGDLTLVRNNKMNLADKGHILGYSSEEVAQCAPITKTLLQHGLIGKLLVIALPHRVKAVYICDNYIHFLSFFSRESSLKIQKYSFLFLFANRKQSLVELFPYYLEGLAPRKRIH